MKKLMLISLFIIMSFCRAVDTYESWNRAIQQYQPIELEQKKFLKLEGKQITEIPAFTLHQLSVLNLNDNLLTEIPALIAPHLQNLFLDDNLITEIPAAGLTFSQLKSLDLVNNQIENVDHEAILQFPELMILELSRNPITPEEVDKLKQTLKKTHPNLLIVDNDVGPHNKRLDQCEFDTSSSNSQVIKRWNRKHFRHNLKNK